MTYRYGDATVFPLDDNFIETLVAAVDACVGLFHACTAADQRRERTSAIERELDDELQRLTAIERAVDAAMAPMGPSAAKHARPYQMTARKVADAAHAVVKGERAALGQRRDALMRELHSEDIAARVREAMTELLQAHELPRTRWTIRWKAGEATVARAVAPCGITANFELQMPGGSRWLAAVPVGAFAPSLTLTVPKAKGLLRKGGDRREELHRFFITSIESTPERDVIVVQAKLKQPTHGYRITTRAVDQSSPIVHPVDEQGRITGTALAPTGATAIQLGKMWQGLEGEMNQLLRSRRRLVSSFLGEVEMAQILDPGSIAEAILGALAPLTREMRLRSGVPGELVLKRDLGDGRREEIYVPRQELEKKFESLTFAQRACFEAIGVGNESTREFVAREFPLVPPAPAAPTVPAKPGPPAKPAPPPSPPAPSNAVTILADAGEKNDPNEKSDPNDPNDTNVTSPVKNPIRRGTPPISTAA